MLRRAAARLCVLYGVVCDVVEGCRALAPAGAALPAACVWLHCKFRAFCWTIYLAQWNYVHRNPETTEPYSCASYFHMHSPNEGMKQAMTTQTNALILACCLPGLMT